MHDPLINSLRCRRYGSKSIIWNPLVFQQLNFQPGRDAEIPLNRFGRNFISHHKGRFGQPSACMTCDFYHLHEFFQPREVCPPFSILYPQDNDYEHHVRQRVFQFMHERLGVPQADAYGIWQKAFAIYNQSLRALKQTGYVFEAEEYWNFIRQGAEDFLTPDPEASSHPQCIISSPLSPMATYICTPAAFG